jgi:16S rRNA G527 N7-methylase RsmG
MLTQVESQLRSARKEFREQQHNNLLIRAYVRSEDVPVGKGRMDRFLRNIAEAGLKQNYQTFALDTQHYQNATPLVRNMKSGDTIGLLLGKDNHGNKCSYSVHVHGKAKNLNKNILVTINAGYPGNLFSGEFHPSIDKTKILRTIYSALQPSKMEYAFMTTKPDDLTRAHDYKEYALQGDMNFLRIIDLLNRHLNLTSKNDDERVVYGQLLEQYVIGREQLKKKFHQDHQLSDMDTLLTRDEMKRLQNIFGEYESILEQRSAKQIIESRGKSGLEVFPYFLRYDILTDRELQLIDSKNIKNICMIGGGQLPISAIMYAQKTTAYITIIEKSGRRVNLSRKVVEALGLQDRIIIINKKAQEVDYSQMDAVIFAAMADPKHEVLLKVSETNFPKTILLRTPLNDARVLYKGFTASELKSQLGEREKEMHHYFRTDTEYSSYHPVNTNDDIAIFSHTILYPILDDGSKPNYVSMFAP